MARKSRINIYRGYRNFLLGFNLTSGIVSDKGSSVIDHRDTNGKGLARESKMSLVKTRGKRRTPTDYRKIY